jgi:hypothetical protein
MTEYMTHLPSNTFAVLEATGNWSYMYDVLVAKLDVLCFRSRWTDQGYNLMETSAPNRAAKEPADGEGRLSRSATRDIKRKTR